MSLDADFFLRMFGPGNPQWVKKALEENRINADTLRDWSCDPKTRLHGAPAEKNELWEDSPSVTRATHVFPVVQQCGKTGFMVPLEIKEAGTWHLSDAMGRFDPKEDHPGKALASLLGRVEKAWDKASPGAPLLLHERFPMSVRLLCPVHMDLIDGASLQLPLAVALLREAAARAGARPWGDAPVFATGRIDDRGVFLGVKNVREKLEAFVREYKSTNYVIILFGVQKKELAEILPGLSEKNIEWVDNLSELLKLDALNNPLLKLADTPPHESEFPGLVARLKTLHSPGKFNAAENFAVWLEPKLAKHPVLRCQTLCEHALLLCHRGAYNEAEPIFREMRALATGPEKDEFGINEQIRNAAAWATHAFDACDVSAILTGYFKDIEPSLAHASMNERARYWGALSQLSRHAGSYGEAVDAGRRAVKCADRADPRESGRDRNHLVHALLCLAREKTERREEILREAESVLRESEEMAHPSPGKGMYHRRFCEYYRGELNRLQGKPWFPQPDTSSGGGDWSHPRVFAELSSARNTANPVDQRKWHARRAVQEINALAEKEEGLFVLFAGVLGVYENILTNNPPAIDGVAQWLDRHDKTSGWRKRIEPALDRLKSNPAEGAEALCEAVPHL